MLIKLGVDISRLHDGMRRGLNAIDRAFRGQKLEAVITSTFDGNHSPGSLHYQHKAVDVRLPPEKNREAVGVALDFGLPDKTFDIVWEKTHIHIEFDPK